jgi:hypothetical protein
MCDLTNSHALYFIAPHEICTNSAISRSNSWKHPCSGPLKDCWVELCLSASDFFAGPFYVCFHNPELSCSIPIIRFLGIVTQCGLKFDIITFPISYGTQLALLDFYSTWSAILPEQRMTHNVHGLELITVCYAVLCLWRTHENLAMQALVGLDMVRCGTLYMSLSTEF